MGRGGELVDTVAEAGFTGERQGEGHEAAFRLGVIPNLLRTW